MPLILLFLLRDTGDIKRGLLGAVPNRLFEPALAVLADVDETLGGYVRGIFLECCTVGLTVRVMLTLVGVPLRWAIVIGIVSGATNVTDVRQQPRIPLASRPRRPVEGEVLAAPLAIEVSVITPRYRRARCRRDRVRLVAARSLHGSKPV